MPQTLTLAVSQCRTLATLSETLEALSLSAHRASKRNVDLLLFPEAYLGGYPRTCNFGAAVGSRNENGREQFLEYFKAAADLGDTSRGAGDDWVKRRLPVPEGKDARGDGTREYVEKVAAETGVFLVVGLIEKAGGSLYCAVVYVCPRLGCLGKRRKVMPTGTERLIWAQGSPSTLRAVTTTIKGVRLTLAAAICWENYMPLLRYALYSQNVNLYLAPTADARDTWAPLMQTVALEGRCFVISANQCVRKGDLPTWITGRNEGKEGKEGKNEEGKGSGVAEETNNEQQQQQLKGFEDSQHAPWADGRRRKSIVAVTKDNHELCLPATNAATSFSSNSDSTSQHNLPPSSSPSPWVCRGGSMIAHPTGAVLEGPLWEDAGSDDDGTGPLLISTVDFEDCIRGRLDFDAAGSYSRNDAFRLEVEGLDLDPVV